MRQSRLRFVRSKFLPWSARAHRGGEKLLRGLVFAGGMVVYDGVALGACVGDCGGDGRVAINELIIGVKIALGAERQASAPRFRTRRAR